MPAVMRVSVPGHGQSVAGSSHIPVKPGDSGE